MDVSKILSEIDAEITRLQHARMALVGISGAPVAAAAPRRRGRPVGSKNASKTTAAAPVAAPASAPKKRGRKLSAEGRKRIAEAQKKRWAESRKKAA